MNLFKRRSLRSLLRGSWRYVFGKRGQRMVRGLRLLQRLRVMVLLRTPVAARRIGRVGRVRLWADREVFPRVLTLIARAEHTVIIQIFIWKDDVLGRRVAQALLDAADRGVHVFISKDAVGDAFELDEDFASTEGLKDSPLWKRFWAHPNIRISHVTHNDHAKVYVIDDHIILVTGMNIGSEYDADWHDYLVELHDASLVRQYLSHGSIVGEIKPARLVMNTDRQRDVRASVMGLLQSARQSIVIEHCYISDAAVIDLLIKKCHEGIPVTVIIPAQADVHYYTNLQAVSRLMQEAGQKHVRVYLYPGMMHSKVILVDRVIGLLGSANLMANSLDEMGEVNVLMKSRMSGALGKLREILRNDIKRSRPLQTPPVLGYFQRWMSWLKL